MLDTDNHLILSRLMRTLALNRLTYQVPSLCILRSRETQVLPKGPEMLLARVFFHGVSKKSLRLKAEVLSLLFINLRHILSVWRH